MKFNISFNAPTLADGFNKMKYNWKFIEDDIEECDKEFFYSVNYSQIEWKDGIRHGSCFQAAHGMTIDYDNKGEVITSIPEIKQYLSELNVNYLIVNSKSHTPERPRYHILFPFLNKITNPTTYSALVQTFIDQLPGEPDGCVFDTARFMGYTPEEKLVEWHFVEGTYYIDQIIIPNKLEEKKIVKEHKQKITEIKKAIKYNGSNVWEYTDDLMPLLRTESKHVIKCPLAHNAHSHGVDRTKSAFLNYSEKSENWYIFCSVCSPALNGGGVFWMKKDMNFYEQYILNTTKESK